ncbi:hypothetical protein [Methyloglobulus sp.]|uniref:hypothetical protein n=1 Tax=Methyloglobulus sp. TaxID=2518622 RepID=UPI00398A094C
MTRGDVGRLCTTLRKQRFVKTPSPFASGDYSIPVSQRLTLHQYLFAYEEQ